jgi:hypothetical protein
MHRMISVVRWIVFLSASWSIFGFVFAISTRTPHSKKVRASLRRRSPLVDTGDTQAGLMTVEGTRPPSFQAMTLLPLD